MRTRGLVFYCLVGGAAPGLPDAASAQAPEPAAVESVESGEAELLALVAGGKEAVLRPAPLPPGTQFENVVVSIGDSAQATASTPTGRVIYSNTKGNAAIAPGTDILVADDIVTTAPNGCKLTQFSFEVSGRVDPAGIDGPYSVSFALYDTCPGAVPASVRPLRVIGGTAGTADFANGAPRRVHVLLPAPVAVPTRFWLALIFSRINAGPVVGAPAIVGYSMDVYHHQGGTPCHVNFGSSQWFELYGSFNAEFHAGNEAELCRTIHVDYHAANEGGALYNPGALIWLVDDLQLRTPDCRLVGYDVTVRGTGRYNFELRETCDGPPLKATLKEQLVGSNANADATRNLRFIVDPPVHLAQNVFFAARISNSTARLAIAGNQVGIGETDDIFHIQEGSGACVERNALPAVHDALSVTLLCEGEAEPGACCDMFVLECAGGEDGGRPCRKNEDCDGGVCESVCRDVPEINCSSYVMRDFTWEPKWVEGASCAAEPFEHPCGQAACCAPFDTCINATQNECAAIEPVTAARQWQRGRFCEDSHQSCPWSACLEQDGTCSIPHDGPGCEDPSCCKIVCNLDPLCCFVEWDEVCVQRVAELAEADCRYSDANDSCWSISENFGAHSVGASSRTLFINSTASREDSDPAICCHPNHGSVCQGGHSDGHTCTQDSHCYGTDCGTPDHKAQATVWFRFVATHPAVEISTANGDGSGDTIFQLFAVGDPTSEQSACESLIPIGCADDCPDCGEYSAHGRLCVTGLTPGAPYYVMVGSKAKENAGLNRLEIISGNSCRNELPWAAGDCDGNGSPDGCDLATGVQQDCDRSGAADFCELRDEITFDCNLDGLPDQCEPQVQGLPGGTTLWFGYAVTIDGDFAAVGEPGVHQNFQEPGKVHLFQRDGRTWQTAGLMTSPHTGPGDRFGEGLASTSQWLWVTAAGEQPGGAVYVYWREEAGVVLVTRIEPDAALGIAHMGPFIAAHADRAIINAEDAAGALRILVYAFDADHWTLESVLAPTAPRSYSEWVRSPMDIFGPWIVVNTDPLSVFRRTGSAWVAETPIAYIAKGEESRGASLGLHGDWLFVAECGENGTRFLRPYRRDERDWSPDAPIQVTGYCEAGPAVDVFADIAVITAPDADGVGLVFQRQNGAWTPAVDLPYWQSDGPRVALAASSTSVLVGRSGAFDSGFPQSGFAYVVALPPSDCDGNSRPDNCDFRDGLATDCNGNHVPDVCDDLPAFDGDFDGDFDLADAAAMANCFGKSEGGAPCCSVFSGTGASAAVDLLDWKEMAEKLAGP